MSNDSYGPKTIRTLARYVTTLQSSFDPVDTVDVVVSAQRGFDLLWYIKFSVHDPCWFEKEEHHNGYLSLDQAAYVASEFAALRNIAKHGQTAAEYLAMTKAIDEED